MQQIDPDRGALLLNFHDALLAKNLLVTMRELRYFAMDLGLVLQSRMSRQAVTNTVVRALMLVSIEELRQKLAVLHANPTTGEGRFEGWANIILGSTHNKRQGA